MKKYLIYLIICAISIVIIILAFSIDIKAINTKNINPSKGINQVDIISWDKDVQMDLEKEIGNIRGISKDTSSLIYDILLHKENPFIEIDNLPGIGPSTLQKIKALWEVYSQSWNF